VITGFNTDIEHAGTVYHVQTEDKGLETPFILSLVYVGGAILASKRAPYDDLIGATFDQSALSERLQRQHKLICAAVNAGRIEDLKRMSQRDAAQHADATRDAHGRQSNARGDDKGGNDKESLARPATDLSQTADAQATQATVAEKSRRKSKAKATTEEVVRQDEAAQATEPISAGGDNDTNANVVVSDAYPVADALKGTAHASVEVARAPLKSDAAPLAGHAPSIAIAGDEEKHPRPAALGTKLVTAAADVAHALHDRLEAGASDTLPAEIDDALHVELLGEKDYHAGEMVTLRVAVLRGAFGFREVVRGANVTVKVLGTEFRPLILTSKTDDDGVAVVHVWLPRFKQGRAAILVRASRDDCAAELRRIIHHV
jgi:hypothetical protein